MSYTSRLDLPRTVTKASIALLQARLVDAIDLEAQMKQAHWNVRGKDFMQLHGLFDQIHSIVEEFVDTIAERIAALGGVADGRIGTVAATTHLYEYPLEAHGGEAHLKAVAGSLAEFGKLVRADIDAAAEGGDQDTADLFTGISRETDKQLWFVEAHLDPAG
jgi:starvation-inducible DNA-binding protein